MSSATSDQQASSTTYFTGDNDGQWADLNHPLFYYDPSFRQFCLSELQSLESLPANWDAQGAPTIDKQILDVARSFVESLPDHIATRPMIVPLSSGSVQFEWHHGHQALELEFESADSVHYLKWDPSHHIEEENMISVANSDELITLIRWFMKEMLSG